MAAWMSELIEEGKRLLPSGVRKTGCGMVSWLSGLTEEGSQVHTFRGAGCCEKGFVLAAANAKYQKDVRAD